MPWAGVETGTVPEHPRDVEGEPSWIGPWIEEVTQEIATPDPFGKRL